MKVLLGTLVLLFFVCVGQSALALEPYQHTESIADPSSTCFFQFPTFAQCNFTFPRVPNGKILVITHVSAQIEADSIIFENSSIPAGEGSAPLLVAKTNVNIGTLSAPVTYYVSGGDNPRARSILFPGQRGSIFITISGHLVKDKE